MAQYGRGWGSYARLEKSTPELGASLMMAIDCFSSLLFLFSSLLFSFLLFSSLFFSVLFFSFSFLLVILFVRFFFWVWHRIRQLGHAPCAAQLVSSPFYCCGLLR